MSYCKDLGHLDLKYRRSSNLALATSVKNFSKDPKSVWETKKEKKYLNSSSESEQSLLLGRAILLLTDQRADKFMPWSSTQQKVKS